MTSSQGEAGPAREPGDAVREFIRRHRLGVRAGLGIFVLVVSIAALVLQQKAPPVKASAIGARLELAAGEVTLGQDGKKATVVSGVPLPVGATLATGKGARALARLSDGSSVFLRGDTEVTLGAEGMSLAQGEVWLDAPPSERGGLSHTLGDVTLSAVDAGLSMRRSGAEVSVYVTRGLAVVTAPGGRVEVNAGEQATLAGGGAPKVAPLAYWEDWTGGMGDHGPMLGGASGSGRIYGVDLQGAPGAPARTLEIGRQVVRAVVRDGIAETEVDQTFSNPGGREVEGWYWFTVPERAIVSSFAVETNGALVEGEVIEKQEATRQYQTAVRAGNDPALLEWIDGRSYRARIFPVPASGSRRVVLRYVEMLSAPGGRLVYVYPMRSTEEVQIGEFSLSVDLGDAGRGVPIATLADAVVEDGGKRVSMRRSGYAPRADFQLEVPVRTAPPPLRVARFAAGEDRADYVMARYVPDVAWTEIKELPADLVVVVDTSASGDESARQQKAAAAEAILRAMSPSDHFALVALDSSPTILHPKDGLAEASEKEIAAALERLAEHATGGATDLGALFEVALGRVHGKDQPAVIYIGDGIATTGEVSAERIGERLRRSLSASRARFFTVGVGADANHAMLRELARNGGGQWFRIDEVEGATAEVLRLASAIKTPTITDLQIDLGAGLDEPMLSASGKVSRGEEVVLLARTHHALPQAATVKGRVAGKEISKEYAIELDRSVATALVPRFWAAEKVRRLLGDAEPEGAGAAATPGRAPPASPRGKIVELGLDYGLVTPFTSILALESEQAYYQQGIKRRRSPLRGVRLTALDPRAERDLAEQLAPISPRVAMGCSKNDEAPAREVAAVAPAAAPVEQAQSKETGNRYGVRGPAAESQAADAIPMEERAKAEPAPMAPPAPMATAAPEPPGIEADEPPATRAARPVMPSPKPALRSGSDAPAGPPATQRRSPVAIDGDPGRGGANARALEGGQGAKKIDAQGQDKARNEQKAQSAAAARQVAAAPCSDTARRPLAERVVVWSKRLAQAGGVADLIQRYEGARATCELPDWRSKAALLQLVQAKVRTAGAAEALLGHFAGERETQKYVAHAILRRSVEQDIAAVVRRSLFDEKMSWVLLDEELAALATPEDRLARLQQALLAHPDDPEGEIRRVRILAEANQKNEALAYGRRLRDRGFMSPALALQLGDVLARSGFEQDAVRTYSEIVEFDPKSAASRQLLGDVYLRHGWYAAAYRQYATLTDIAPEDPAGWLRLSAAAAGSGRVDEALRIQRKIAAAEGTPGAKDPRAWARMLSAAWLGRLLADPAQAAQKESLTRKLKELQIFSGPAVIRIVIWEDYAAALSLAGFEGDAEAPSGEVGDAPDLGLTSVLMPASDMDRRRWIVRWRKDPPGRDVRFVVTTIAWDGKAFQVSTKNETLAAQQKDVAL